MKPLHSLPAALLATIIFIGLTHAADLQHDFAHPPDSARPWVYWFWLDGNITREGITADLEAMKRVGIGGALIMETAQGSPTGPVAFGSPQWREMFKFACSEAERLGLQINMNNDAGWCGSGGPWITPALSMQKITSSQVNVKGPSHFSAALPLPPTKFNYYGDIEVVAFPTPKVSGAVPLIKDIVGKADFDTSFLIGPADYAKVPPEAVVSPDRQVDLTSRITADGKLDWDVPDGDWTILRIGHTSTGKDNHPAPMAGRGLECDKLSVEATDEFFAGLMAKLIQDVGPLAGKSLASTHIDSWEVGSQNWTPKFRQEFKKRRGYDLMPYLPVVTGQVVESLEVSERFLWDFRQTISELIIDNYAGRMRQLANQKGLRLSIEAYDGNPCDDMAYAGKCDEPMAEFWAYGNNGLSWVSPVEMTSAAHIYGKPIIGAEAFTSNKDERWQATPATIKSLGDWAFCEGINRLVFHRFALQPWKDARPGMGMGPWGLHYERTQTWWELSGAWHEYLARCQFMLRQGQPVTDICYLAPEGAPRRFMPPGYVTGGMAPERLRYGFDACPSDALQTIAEAKAGRLAFPDGMSYRVLSLSDAQTTTPQILRKLKELADGGVTIVGKKPVKSPSLVNYPACDNQVRQLADELWDGKKIIADKNAEQVLAEMNVPPDFQADKALQFTHRRDSGTDIYFISNRTDNQVESPCTFRVAGMRPELWDPVTGAVCDAGEFRQENGTTIVPLRLAPNGSLFVVFRKAATAQPPGGKNWIVLKPGREIAGPWTVHFDPKWGGPESVQFDSLDDWSTRPEIGIKYYSGTATYQRDFDADPVHGRVFLNLGKVQVMARVKLNGADVGTAWTAPWRVEITSALKPGRNHLEIEVANLWINRLIGDEQLPEDSDRKPDRDHTLKSWPTWLQEGKPSPTGRFTFTTHRLWKKTDALRPSGLLGPVRIEIEE